MFRAVRGWVKTYDTLFEGMIGDEKLPAVEVHHGSGRHQGLTFLIETYFLAGSKVNLEATVEQAVLRIGW